MRSSKRSAEAAQGDDGLGQLLVGHGGKHALRKRNGVGAIEAMLTNRCEYARDQERGVGDGAGLDANAVVDFFAFEHRFPEIPRARAGQRPIGSGANLLQNRPGSSAGRTSGAASDGPRSGGFDKRSIERTQIVTPACARGLSPAADIAQRRGRQLPERFVEPGQLAAIGIEQRFHEAMRRIGRFPDQRFPDAVSPAGRVSRRDVTIEMLQLNAANRGACRRPPRATQATRRRPSGAASRVHKTECSSAARRSARIAAASAVCRSWRPRTLSATDPVEWQGTVKLSRGHVTASPASRRFISSSRSAPERVRCPRRTDQSGSLTRRTRPLLRVIRNPSASTASTRACAGAAGPCGNRSEPSGAARCHVRRSTLIVVEYAGNVSRRSGQTSAP